LLGKFLKGVNEKLHSGTNAQFGKKSFKKCSKKCMVLKKEITANIMVY